MKKKIFSCVFATVLVFSTSTSAFAESVTVDGGSQSKDVQGTYTALDEPATVYKVDVSWGTMEFVYNAGTITKTWNPETHSYDVTGPSAGAWSNTENSNKITVTNHSNKALTATVSAKINAEISDVSASVNKGTLDLPDASVGATTETSGRPIAQDVFVSLSGSWGSGTTASTPIGSVTVTISDN